MNEQIVSKQASTLATLQDVGKLTGKIKAEISEITEVKILVETFAAFLDIARENEIENEKDFKDFAGHRKQLAAGMKALEKEIPVTPKGQVFDVFKSGLFSLHKKVKAIMDGFLKSGIEADRIFKEKQNAYLAEQERKQREAEAEARRVAEAERIRIEAEVEAERRRIEAEAAEARRKAEAADRAKQAELQRRMDAAKKEETIRRLEQEQRISKEQAEKEKLAAAERAEQEQAEAEAEAERKKEAVVENIPEILPKKVAGAKLVDVVKIEVTDRILLIQTLITAKPVPLDGFLKVDEVALANYCKKMSLKGKEFPGLKITWKKEAQRGR